MDAPSTVVEADEGNGEDLRRRGMGLSAAEEEELLRGVDVSGMSRGQRNRALRKQLRRRNATLQRKQRRKADAISGKARQRKRKQRARILDHEASEHRVAIEVSPEHMMKEKEYASLVSQLVHCHALNRRAGRPVRLHLTNVAPQGCIRERLLRACAGNLSSWNNVTVSAESCFDQWPASHVVVLSADASDVLHELHADKVYVVGGMVDRNRHKGYTVSLAETHKVSMARLPLQEHVQLVGRGVLTVDQVFGMLLAFQDTGDWRRAALLHIPKRRLHTDHHALRKQYIDEQDSCQGDVVEGGCDD